MTRAQAFNSRFESLPQHLPSWVTYGKWLNLSGPYLSCSHSGYVGEMT